MVVHGGCGPTEWEPVAARHTEMVACVRERVVRQVGCGRYETEDLHISGYVSRVWVRWVVRVVTAADGRVLAEKTFDPTRPAKCPRVIRLAPGQVPQPKDLLRTPDQDAVQRFLRPFVGDIVDDEAVVG
jgi:hypothetical protein